MKIVKFTKNHSPYKAGDVAQFSDEDADVRIQAGVAQLVKEVKVQPEVRTAERVDSDGHVVIESRQVEDDLERNVDLPKTEGGGQPKDEAHRKEEEEQNESAAQAVEVKAEDRPQVNKQVQSAPKKK
jgi:hypothetical protein